MESIYIIEENDSLKTLNPINPSKPPPRFEKNRGGSAGLIPESLSFVKESRQFFETHFLSTLKDLEAKDRGLISYVVGEGKGISKIVHLLKETQSNLNLLQTTDQLNQANLVQLAYQMSVLATLLLEGSEAHNQFLKGNYKSAWAEINKIKNFNSFALQTQNWLSKSKTTPVIFFKYEEDNLTQLLLSSAGGGYTNIRVILRNDLHFDQNAQQSSLEYFFHELNHLFDRATNHFGEYSEFHYRDPEKYKQTLQILEKIKTSHLSPADQVVAKWILAYFLFERALTWDEMIVSGLDPRNQDPYLGLLPHMHPDRLPLLEKIVGAPFPLSVKTEYEMDQLQYLESLEVKFDEAKHFLRKLLIQ